MSLYIILLLCVYHAVYANVSANYHCSYWANEKIHECVKPVQNFAKSLDQKDTTLSSNVSEHKLGNAISIPKIGGHVFHELCSLIRDFNNCVVEGRQECPKHIMISLIDASYGFLCNEGYEAFMSSAECLMDLDRTPSVKYCHDETLTDIEKANAEAGITLPVKLDRMCEALNYFSGCVRMPIRHNCGVAAWAVIFRVLRDTTSALLPNCQFTGQSRKLFSTTETTPIRAYKPAVIQITPRIISSSINDKKEVHLFIPNRKNDFLSTRTQGYNSESLYYSNRKLKSRGEKQSPVKLVEAASSFSFSLRYAVTLDLVYFIVAFILL